MILWKDGCVFFFSFQIAVSALVFTSLSFSSIQSQTTYSFRTYFESFPIHHDSEALTFNTNSSPGLLPDLLLSFGQSCSLSLSHKSQWKTIPRLSCSWVCVLLSRASNTHITSIHLHHHLWKQLTLNDFFSAFLFFAWLSLALAIRDIYNVEGTDYRLEGWQQEWR